jgi:hypothetical protein
MKKAPDPPPTGGGLNVGIAALEDTPPVGKGPLKDDAEALVGIAALAISVGENSSTFCTFGAGSSGVEGAGEVGGGGSGGRNGGVTLAATLVGVTSAAANAASTAGACGGGGGFGVVDAKAAEGTPADGALPVGIAALEDAPPTLRT